MGWIIHDGHHLASEVAFTIVISLPIDFELLACSTTNSYCSLIVEYFNTSKILSRSTVFSQLRSDPVQRPFLEYYGFLGSFH